MTPAQLADAWRAYADKLAPHAQHHDEVVTLRRCARELAALPGAPRMTLRKLLGCCAVVAAVVAWSCSTSCDHDTAPALDAAADLPACADLVGCDVALCDAAGTCRCLRPGLPPVTCQR